MIAEHQMSGRIRAISHVSPNPEIIHLVAVIFIAIAVPLAAKVRLPVDPPGDKVSVSVAMLMVTVFRSLTNQ
ncbi:MAG: hypothetical protein H7838_14110, partial [Magnetococcus sp. DMHC-8]